MLSISTFTLDASDKQVTQNWYPFAGARTQSKSLKLSNVFERASYFPELKRADSDTTQRPVWNALVECLTLYELKNVISVKRKLVKSGHKKKMSPPRRRTPSFQVNYPYLNLNLSLF